MEYRQRSRPSGSSGYNAVKLLKLFGFRVFIRRNAFLLLVTAVILSTLTGLAAASFCSVAWYGLAAVLLIPAWVGVEVASRAFRQFNLGADMDVWIRFKEIGE